MSRISKLAQPRRRITRRSLLELLPVAHVSFHIFSYLDTASLASISAGCRDLYGLASSDIVWRDRVSAGHNAGTMASSLKSQFVQRRRELVARRSAKLKETFRRIQERSGVETCLSRTIERLEVSLTVSINGAVCDLLAFRKRTQQGRKEQFRALGAAPAPNLATGALRFDQAAVLKLAVPPNLSEDQLASLEVTCTTKLKSCGTTRVLAWSKNHGTAPERLGSTGFSQISLGRSAVLFGSLDQAMGPRRGVALLVVSVHHLDVLAALGIAGTMHEPITDDLDRNYGMHGYTGAFTIRSLGQTWWSSSFGDLDSRSSIAGGGEFARFPVLDAEHCEGDVTRRIEFKVPGRGRDGETERPSLYFRTETFSGCLDGYVVVDMTLWDEHREAFWAFTRVLPIQTVDAERSQAFNFNDGVHGNGFEVVHEDQEKGRLRIGIAPMHDRATVVKEMDFALRTRAISSWFGM
ncbi:F-box only protein 15 [Hondaea fermentalgiana]|uniref:F-box only protein 15 n=1 Tax=Hondaea fermentalgiana TaxID=2315210 RepID=A0A2R5G3Z2_9STRA|nr:F-box only protein 15 [Hondaea fermentalgiana]|eukprot:GBG25742.1 F-box only protein 15 [Hondaea fermentalgiana]